MSKKLVVFLGKADWAGSSYSAVRAINRVGRIECRHISLNQHIFGYPSDVVIPICYTQNPGKASDYPEEYKKAMELLERADLVHLWNDLLPSFNGLIPVPSQKVKTNTFTGTLYRENHATINQYLRHSGINLVVQNPTYRYPEEYDAEFIPHAVEIDALKPLPISERDQGAIGCYRPEHKSTTAHEDIVMLEHIIKTNHSGWHLTLDWTMPWETRMKLMPKCRHFFEYMDPNMGYWGRSALEACAMGVPTFSYVSQKALDMSMGRLGNPAIVHVTRKNLSETMLRYLNLSEQEYAELAENSRKWLVDHYSFERVGELYTRFFEKLLPSASIPVPAKPKLTLSNRPEPVFLRDRTVHNDDDRVGRNDLCPCGSGLKYKKCCLNKTLVK